MFTALSIILLYISCLYPHGPMAYWIMKIKITHISLKENRLSKTCVLNKHHVKGFKVMTCGKYINLNKTIKNYFLIVVVVPYCLEYKKARCV